jgi:hypothetical protein
MHLRYWLWKEEWRCDGVRCFAGFGVANRSDMDSIGGYSLSVSALFDGPDVFQSRVWLRVVLYARPGLAYTWCFPQDQ